MHCTNSTMQIEGLCSHATHKQYYAKYKDCPLVQCTNNIMQSTKIVLPCNAQTILCKVQGLSSCTMHKQYYAKYKDCALMQCTNNTMLSTRTVLPCNAQTILCKVQGLCSHAMHKQYYAKYKDCPLMLSAVLTETIYIYDVGLMINP